MSYNDSASVCEAEKLLFIPDLQGSTVGFSWFFDITQQPVGAVDTFLKLICKAQENSPAVSIKIS